MPAIVAATGDVGDGRQQGAQPVFVVGEGGAEYPIADGQVFGVQRR
jgi:hypothetical protein